MIDGGRARPLHGQPPAHAGAVVTAPVVNTAAVPATAALTAPTAPAEQALVGYLSNMRDMINAQRDVLLGYFGAAHVPPPVRQTDGVAIAVAPVARSDRAPASQAPARPDRTTLLLDIVSRQTGYPAEMLDLDLDLEADFSIDSIKRAEVIGELARSLDLQAALGGGINAGIEQLAGRKTLRGVIAWLDAHVPSGQAGNVATQRVEAPSAPAPAALDGPALLLDVVSRCTGYPAEVLDPDLDLEADLSIDSIKRAEIVAQFTSRAGIAGGVEGGAAQDHLASLKTLRAMMSWLEQRAGATPAATAVKLAQPVAAAPPSALARYVTRWGPEAAARPDAAALAQKSYLITEDGLGVAAALAARLAAHGALPRVASLAEVRAQPPEVWATHGLIHLACPGADDAKTLFPLLRDALMGGAHSVLLGANLAGGAAAMPPGAGLAGLVKCASREFPAVRACLIDLDFSEPAAQLAAAFESEILGAPGTCEVMYRGGLRSAPSLVAEELAEAPAAVPELGRDSVVLITGGARGITARVAVALARRTGCRIELVGRSALPDAAETAGTAGITDTRQLRQALLRQFPGGKPAEIEILVQRLLADREMRNTLAEIGQAGSPLGYTALDVRDRAAFAAHIDQLYARHGRIDGVIHGAGLIEDRLIRDKTEASFARVFDTKVQAAIALRENIRADAAFVVFFSSVSSVFGNRGQADYAAANDVLDRLAGAWQARVQGRVVSVNWGPWADTGMVSDAVRESYRRRGIGLIPQDAGVNALLRELASGARDPQVVLMCGAPENFMA
jgi:NAD(P)-dependent dehydrogenase (short-subunit alcohol dehydrogenase family)/acyl carrier protein